MVGVGADKPMGLVARRLEFLELLAGESLEKPSIRERLDCSRSTVDRSVGELSEAGLVERTDSGYTTTLPGRLAARRYRACLSETDAVFDAADVLAPLPPDCAVSVDAVDGADADVASRPAPYRPLERVRESVREADRYRAVLPVLEDPRRVRLCYERVVSDGCPATLVVDRELFESLRSEFPRQLAAMADTGRFEVHVGDVPEYGVVLAERDEGTVVHLVVYDGGGLHGVVHNDTAGAVDWARGVVDRAVADAKRVTDRLAPAGGSDGDALPPSLAAEGFVEVSTGYFADRSVADPTDAWRAGLGLAEVQAGYPVDRTAPAADGAEGPSLTDWLRGRLRQGGDCVLLGPPGAGKSTTCKQVACAWYRAGDPVFYRESGHDRPFESAAALAEAVRSADGRPLVVVEDAVRPEADAAFAAREAVGDAAAFLFDARRSEWTDPPGEADAVDPEGVETVTMPRLLGVDCERLVEQFERTVGGDVDVSADRLREDVAAATDGEGPQPGTTLLFTHRLANHVDPLTDAGPTSLEAQARDLAADLASLGEGALEVGVAVNLLNAAGIAVHPDHVEALVAPRPAGDRGRDRDGVGCRPMTVDAALDRLDGRALFGRTDDGSYRTVHETWSAVFLSQLVETDPFGDVDRADAGELVTDGAARDSATGETADETVPGTRDDQLTDHVTRVLHGLLSLADDPSVRERVRETVDDPAVLGRAEDRPGEWADDLLDGVYALARRRPKVAPLLPEPDDLALPECCGPARPVLIERSLAAAHLTAGVGDAAEAAVDRMEARLDAVADDLPDDRVRALRATALHRRGQAARHRGDLDEMREAYRRALAAYEAMDDAAGESNCLNGLGIVADRAGDWEDAVDYYRQSLDRAREAGETRLVPSRLLNIGLMHLRGGDYDAAESRLREAVEAAGEVGTVGDEAQALNNLGVVARDRGDLATAESRFLESLERRRDLGLVRDSALTLWDLAEIARRRGDYEGALSYARRARDTYDRVGDEVGVARSRVVLAHAHHDDGDAERAVDLAERALETLSEGGDRLAEASARIVLGKAFRATDRLDDAAAQFDRASDVCEDLGTPLGRAWCRRQRGLLAADRGEEAAARDQLAEALELAEEAGLDRTVADVTADLGRLALDGDPERARSRLETAVDAYLDCDADQLALACLDPLVEACTAIGDRDAAVERCEQAVDLAAEHDVDDARERFRERRRRLEQ